MVSHSNSTVREADLGTLLRAVVVLIVALALVSFFAGQPVRAPFVSSELAFSDGSSEGLAIIPASCESSPPSPHFAGECGEPTYSQGGYTPGYTQGLYQAGYTPPDNPTSGNGCVLALMPSTIIAGGSSVLSWTSTFQIFGIPFPLTGVISPAPGAVAATGVTTVAPTVTTTYSGTFTPRGSLNGIPPNWITPVTCSSLLTVLPTNPGPTACLDKLFCVGQDVYRQSTSCANTFVQRCPYGCANGACLGAPSPAGFIRVRPSLVRSGDTTTVEWSASHVSSCTVSAPNGDSWTGASGSQTSRPITSQTTYTLSCIGLDGTSIGRSAVVNITPIFDEQ